MSLAENDSGQPTTTASTALIPDTSKLFAAFGLRMTGVGLDLLIAVFIARGVETYVLVPIGLTSVDNRLVIVVFLLLYFSLFWSSQLRATPAQFLLGMRVVDEMGEKLSLARSILRSVLLVGLIVATLTLFKFGSNPYFIAIALVGYALLFLSALTPNRQAGHDLFTHSLVVNKIALKSSEHRRQLREHVSASDPDSGRQRRPSIIRIAGNVLVLGVPVVVLLITAQIANDRDLRYRINYAIEQVADLKTAVSMYYVEHTAWPSSESELMAATRADYPEGGYYQLEDDGVIRIRFTVNSELRKGSIVLIPRMENDSFVWQCRTEDGFAQQYMGGWCRE